MIQLKLLDNWYEPTVLCIGITALSLLLQTPVKCLCMYYLQVWWIQLQRIVWVRLFLQGVANRGASIRVGRDTEKDGKGYFEDRRPASNMDPYVVTSMIAETTILWKPWKRSAAKMNSPMNLLCLVLLDGFLDWNLVQLRKANFLNLMCAV